MNAKPVESKFTLMGARFKVRVSPESGDDYVLNIQRDRHGEFFELRASRAMGDSLEVTVPQTEKRDRHLLLFVRKPEGKLDRFLCGHDEREWFVAAVPKGASSVDQAKEVLKPAFLRARQDLLEVPVSQRNRRRNAAFRRQGEWFFVPVAQWLMGPVNEKFTLRHEPIRRGAGKAHMVEELHRVGGELVYVCSRQPNGINETQYQRLVQNNPAALQWGWQALRRNPRVYARGTVRHPDHATILLPDWHQVVLNTENETEAMRNVAFLD